MKNGEIRFTDTNSADDSKGRTWGLDGNLFWYLIVGAFVSVALMLFLFSAYRKSFIESLAIAAIPLVVTLVYIFGVRQGKPPRYDMDCLEYLFCGKGFSSEQQPKLQHPLNRHV